MSLYDLKDLYSELKNDPMCREKILEYLSNQKKALSLDSNFEINLNRNEMADYLALDRSNLSRELGKLKKEGIIDFKKNKFKLL